MATEKFDAPSYVHNQHDVPPPEYRVRTVVRHVVTRYCHPYTMCDAHGNGAYNVKGSSSVICEVANDVTAYEIAKALAKQEGATVQQD